jgi:excisionase family DNA binding protein
MEQRYVTPTEFAQDTGYKPETIRKKLREGKLPSVKWGRSWRVLVPQAYDELEETHTEEVENGNGNKIRKH